MGRKAAVFWHASVSVLAGIAYYFAVLPRPLDLSGKISHGFGTAGRIVAGVLVGLAALPVVFTLLRSRQSESGAPRLALRMQVASIVAHLLAAVLIVGTAVAEIWLTLDAAGQWLFGVYGAAAAIALLGMLAFYLSFVAALPPKPLKPKKEKRPGRGKAADDAATEAEVAEEAEEAAETPDESGTETEAAETEEVAPDTAVQAQAESPESDDLPTAEDTVAVEAPRGGLRNRRPSGKSAGSRRRRRSRGAVAVDDAPDD